MVTTKSFEKCWSADVRCGVDGSWRAIVAGAPFRQSLPNGRFSSVFNSEGAALAALGDQPAWERLAYGYAKRVLQRESAARGVDIRDLGEALQASVAGGALRFLAGKRRPAADTDRQFARRCVRRAALAVLRTPLGGAKDAMNHRREIRPRHADGGRYGNGVERTLELIPSPAVVEQEPWSPERLQALLSLIEDPQLALTAALLAAGKDQAQVAAELGVARSTVFYRVARLQSILRDPSIHEVIAMALHEVMGR